MVLSPACVLLLSSQLLGCTAELGRAGDGPQSALSMAPDVSCLPLPICSLPSPPWLPGGPVISGFPSSLASGKIPAGDPGREEREIGVSGCGFLPLGSPGAPVWPTRYQPRPRCLPIVITAPSSCAIRSSVRRSPHRYCLLHATLDPWFSSTPALLL